MTPEIAKALVQHLYEGRSACPDDIWAPGVSFRDPLVVVSGIEPIAGMFAKINRLLPATELVSFQPDATSPHVCAWLMQVDYKRSVGGRAHTMRSTLEVDLVDGRVHRLTEHWLSPVALRGDKQNPMGKLFRASVGRLIGR